MCADLPGFHCHHPVQPGIVLVQLNFRLGKMLACQGHNRLALTSADLQQYCPAWPQPGAGRRQKFADQPQAIWSPIEGRTRLIVVDLGRQLLPLPCRDVRLVVGYQIHRAREGYQQVPAQAAHPIGHAEATGILGRDLQCPR